MYKQFQSREVRPIIKFRGSMEISASLQIPVISYTKTSHTAFPTMKKFSKFASESSDVLGGKISNDRTFFHHDDPSMATIGPEKQVKGFQYGRQIVPIPNEVFENMKVTDEERCLKILGFSPKASVPRHHSLAGIDILLPVKEIDHAKAFNSIVISLQETDRVGIGRYTSRNNTTPKLVVIKPNISSRGCCLYLSQIPTAEDLRDYQFPSLVMSTETQRNLAAEFIESMDLMEFRENETDEPREALRPSETFNPAIQTLNLNLTDRGMTVGPHPTGIIRHSPKKSKQWRPEQIMFGQSESIRKKYKSCFDLNEKEIANERRDRVYWREVIESERQKLGQGVTTKIFYFLGRKF